MYKVGISMVPAVGRQLLRPLHFDRTYKERHWLPFQSRLPLQGCLCSKLSWMLEILLSSEVQSRLAKIQYNGFEFLQLRVPLQ